MDDIEHQYLMLGANPPAPVEPRLTVEMHSEWQSILRLKAIYDAKFKDSSHGYDSDKHQYELALVKFSLKYINEINIFFYGQSIQKCIDEKTGRVHRGLK